MTSSFNIVVDFNKIHMALFQGGQMLTEPQHREASQPQWCRRRIQSQPQLRVVCLLNPHKRFFTFTLTILQQTHNLKIRSPLNLIRLHLPRLLKWLLIKTSQVSHLSSHKGYIHMHADTFKADPQLLSTTSVGAINNSSTQAPQAAVNKDITGKILQPQR